MVLNMGDLTNLAIPYLINAIAGLTSILIAIVSTLGLRLLARLSTIDDKLSLLEEDLRDTVTALERRVLVIEVSGKNRRVAQKES